MQGNKSSWLQIGNIQSRR